MHQEDLGDFFPPLFPFFSFGEDSSMTKTSVQARYDHPHIYYPGCPLSLGFLLSSILTLRRALSWFPCLNTDHSTLNTPFPPDY